MAKDRAGWSEEKREKRKQYNREYHAQRRGVHQAQNAKYRAEHREHLMQLDREKYARIQAERMAAGLSRIVRKRVNGLLECTKCHEMKPPVGFYRMSKYSTKYMSQCRLCVNESNLDHYHKNSVRESARAVAYRLQKKYGMTPADLDALLLQQQNKCIICEREFLRTTAKNKPKVDHDHITGKVRGVLCDDCNRTLGYVQDNPSILRKMIAYLEHHGVTA